MTSLTDKRRFREFLARAEDLPREPFVASGFTVGPNLVAEPTSALNPPLQAPPEVEFRSVLSLVRQFVSSREAINIARVSNLLMKHLGTAAQSTDETKRSRATELVETLIMQRKLREGGMGRIAAEIGQVIYGRPLTPDEVMALWFNAEYAHTDTDRRETLNMLSSDQRLRLKHAFFDIVTTTIVFVLTVKGILEEAQALNLIGP